MDNNHDIYTMNVNGSNIVRLTTHPDQDAFATWSPDGTKIAWEGRRGDGFIFTMDADGSNQVQVTSEPGYQPAWSPDGAKIAFAKQPTPINGVLDIYTMDPDGTNQTEIVSSSEFDFEPDWSPDGQKLVFSRTIDGNPGNRKLYSVNADGTGETLLTPPTEEDLFASWSPDGKQMAFIREVGVGLTDLFTMNADGTGAVTTGAPGIFTDWQPVFTYPRPRSTARTTVRLLPALGPCASPNSSHAGPLGGTSCVSSDESSGYLTVGTPDYNGKPVQSVGHVELAAVVGNPSTPTDESDISIDARMTDVRCQRTGPSCTGPLADYLGNVQLQLDLRITDRQNGGSGTEAGTVSDLTFPLTVPCSGDSSNAVGSTCAISTTADAVLGGTVVEGQRTMHKILDVNVYDGGADGDVTTADNTLFMTQGIFVP